MRIDLPSVESLKVEGKRVLVRVDFNVPLDKESGEITDDTRIQKSLPTINYLLNEGASLVLVSHLGRPKGRSKKLSLAKVAERLNELLPSNQVTFSADELGEPTVAAAKKLDEGEILVLDNIRFYAEETSDEKAERKKLAATLAKHADFYVDDAFGACHRAHASIVEIAEALPSAAGLLLKREIDVLQNLLTKAEKPFVAIIGGAKVSSKITVLEKLIPKVNTIMIGGAMAYTFLKSRLVDTGTSMVEKEYLSKAFQIVDKADYHRCDFLLPDDHVVTKEFSDKAKAKTVGKSIPDGFMGMDIGPKTVDKYIKAIKGAKTVLWNGPMGVFEMPPFAKGTMKLAKALTKVKGTTVVGGGDSVYAIREAGVEEQITHVSTGGGATLEFIEGKKLPGVEVLIKEE